MLLRCGHHGQWQISNINYRNLFFCHVCIAMPNTPKSRLQTHLLYLIWVLSVIAASPLPLTLAFSHTLLLCVCCDVCEGNGQAVCVLVERKQLKKGNEMSIWHCFLSRSSAVPSLTSPLFLSPGSNLKAAGGGGREGLLSSVEPNEFYDELLRLVVRCGCCWFTFVLFACKMLRKQHQLTVYRTHTQTRVHTVKDTYTHTGNLSTIACDCTVCDKNSNSRAQNKSFAFDLCAFRFNFVCSVK